MSKVTATEFVSPYRAAKIVSAEMERTIAPQVVYGLIKKDKIAASTNSTGKLQVTVDAVRAYFQKEEVPAEA